MALDAKWKMMMALNAELRRNSGSKRQWKMLMVLNAKLRRNSGSECQMGNADGAERRTEKR